MTLRELYGAHDGKVADKWSLYLEVYERLFGTWRDRPLSLVEIGVQNGGSLELWARYFPQATAIVGCDIDPRCGSLRFDDPRIEVIVGAVNTEAAYRAITARLAAWDIFIDDGSHTSRDIVMAFLNYYPRVKPGGYFVVEDLHCSYLPAFGGGAGRPDTSMEFLKTLADSVNRPWWERSRPPAALLDPVLGPGHGIDPAIFESVRAVTFLDSLCVIEKRAEGEAPGVGTRVTVGREAAVEPKALEQREKLREM